MSFIPLFFYSSLLYSSLLYPLVVHNFSSYPIAVHLRADIDRYWLILLYTEFGYHVKG